MNQFNNLFSPYTIKNTTIRNRIVLPPMNTNFADPDGSVNERFTKYYVERGKGGAGLLIVSSAYIEKAAKKRSGALLLDDDRFIPKLKAFTSAVQATGAKIFQQLNHNGRLLSSSKELKTAATAEPIAPSAIPHLSTGEMPRALTLEEIQEFVEKFAQAGRRAKAAGFDGVELHGTHGYLINQFFSCYSNRRTDEYGGNLENRMRFPLEVYRRTRELTGEGFLICYRINAQEFAPVETPLEEVIVLCRRLEKEGVDLLHVSVGNSETAAGALRMIPPLSVPQGCYADLAAAVKVKVEIPVIAVGRISSPEIAEQILQEKKADFVAIGRALIADPYWPEKALKGDREKIRPCIACNQGCIERLSKEKVIRCFCNPEVGLEEELSPAEAKKKVMVVGGGPGGMEAAIVAASRGHDVELYEKENSLGGQCSLVASSPGMEDFPVLKDFWIQELKRLKVLTHLNKNISAGEITAIQPDVVILATGSVPLVPEIPGVEKENVKTAWDVLAGKEVGDTVAVIGGGFVGIETAIFLERKGKEVVIIEKLDEVMQDAGPLNRARLRRELDETEIVLKCKTELLAIDDRKITVRGVEGEYDIPIGTVVLALGAKSRNTLQRELEGKVPELYAVGDCVEARNMIEAIHEAYDVAAAI
jgi:2,4-dienoyl-CoA reductase-like NADH-dependent reductase (Old Yellow Enzyme family)/thioredoxin reductase